MSSSLAACEVPPTVVGQNLGLQICGIDVPVTKIDFKRNSKKTDVTTTAGYYLGHIWEEFSPGSRGGTVSWEGFWRISQAVTPPMLRTGRIYPLKLFVRRPGTNSTTDPGLFYSMNIFVDDSSLSMDPKMGMITWHVSTTINGPIVDPT